MQRNLAHAAQSCKCLSAQVCKRHSSVPIIAMCVRVWVCAGACVGVCGCVYGCMRVRLCYTQLLKYYCAPAAFPSAVSVVDSMASTASHALTCRLSSSEVADLIVEYAGEVAPPGISCEDWLFVVRRGASPRAVLYHRTPDDVSCTMENYDHIMGPRNWCVEHRLFGTTLGCQFAMTPGIAKRLLAAQLIFELQHSGQLSHDLCRLSGRREDIDIDIDSEQQYFGCRILDVNPAGTAFQFNAGAHALWCRFSDDTVTCTVTAALFTNITD